MRQREIGGILVGLGGASVIGFLPVIRPDLAYAGIGVGVVITLIGIVMFFWRDREEKAEPRTAGNYINTGINAGHIGPVNNQCDENRSDCASAKRAADFLRHHSHH